MTESEDLSRIRAYWPEFKNREIRKIGEGGYARCYTIDDIVFKKYTEEGISELYAHFILKGRSEGLEGKCDRIGETIANLFERMPEPNPFMPEFLPEYTREDIIAYKKVEGMTVAEIISAANDNRIELPFELKIKLACAIAEPVIYLQRMKKAHGDLTPSNIVMKGIGMSKGEIVQYRKDGRRCGRTRQRAILIDWDHAEDITSIARPRSIFDSIGHTTSGTREYLPSEYLSTALYEDHSETETLGKIWYEIMTGKKLCPEVRRFDAVQLLMYGDIMHEKFSTLPGFQINGAPEAEEGIRKTIIKTLYRSVHRPSAARAQEELQKYLGKPLHSTK